jgi:hypothetical protein
LLANRIALLKQEETKTWKKIEEAKKRTVEIHHFKKRNEDKVQKVSQQAGTHYGCIENSGLAGEHRVTEDEQLDKLCNSEVATGREEENSGGHLPFQA